MASEVENGKKVGATTIIVVGVSAGGMDALTRLVAQLPEDFAASIFVVQHMSADTTGDALLAALYKHGKLKCTHPRDA